LPYLVDRPESLNRHPDGIKGKNFFQKNLAGDLPAWIQTIELPTDSKRRSVINYLLCQNAATLVYLANLGCIELNPWSSRRNSLDAPDYLLIDLDPEDVSFATVVRAAQEVRRVLDMAGAPCYCKTSGKRGLHVYVPLGAQHEYEVARRFAELVAQLVHGELPDTTSLLRMPAQRQQRVYLDCLQNGRGKTLAAPYSVRPVAGAQVSTPLQWTEVRSNLDPTRFTIKTMPERLNKLGDIWKPVLGEGIALAECVERLSRHFGPKARK
jgi:bifunctional non-homologous end joining protein LigD